MRAPTFPHPQQYLLFSIIFILVIPGYVKSYFIVILIFISLMTKDVVHIFLCLVVICVSSLEKCLFKLFDLLFSHWVIC